MCTEIAPLLQDPDAEEPITATSEDATFGDRLNAIAQEPLTPLTKILLVLVLVLMILSSVCAEHATGGLLYSQCFQVFLGLFAGVQHKLNVERGRHGHPAPPSPPVTTVLTQTQTKTQTQTQTQTETEIRTTTSGTTRTETNTRTVSPPVPTKKPEEVLYLPFGRVFSSHSISSPPA